jgi:hypothetical protein
VQEIITIYPADCVETTNDIGTYLLQIADIASSFIVKQILKIPLSSANILSLLAFLVIKRRKILLFS